MDPKALEKLGQALLMRKSRISKLWGFNGSLSDCMVTHPMMFGGR
eukprot:CAMPEP_0184687262 /NCGR_PEP_ID=MMETSP0312-20130426/25792_1 /TAXON_ID=31354 /ORGANISM="Compsopogon coeruleus, Strain SAG 36.94" /LENGTH=44 /DNA_ID= /DNA_START= /DNA_END= /DNA_ORIENTATION=